MDRFLDDFGQTNYDNLILIRYHVWWPSGQDPFYVESGSFVTARVNYYGLNFVPWPAVDGTYMSSNSQFEYRYNQRVALESPLVLSIDVTPEGDSMAVSVDVYAESDPGVGNMKLRIAVTETGLEYHSPYGEIWNDVMRRMIPDAYGVDLGDMAQGDSAHYDGYFTMQPHWDMANLSVVAFVQTPDNNNEILQGARWTAPAGAIAGTVIDDEGTPVENALVTLLETGRFDSTDASGEFTLNFLVGNYDIETVAIGHYPDTTTVEIFDDSTVAVQVTLNPLPTSVFAGTVTDQETGDGIDAKVVLMMRDAPWDSAFTNPTTGFFNFRDLPVTYTGIQEYTGIEIYPELPYPITTIDQEITVAEDDTATMFPQLLPADVLLVDDDDGLGYESYFTPAIDSAGRTFVHLDAQASSITPVEAMSLFPTTSKIVWFTGDATSSTLTQEEQDSLARFLDDGGKLFLTGQNIAEDLTVQQSTFLDDYLHTSWLENAPQAFMHGNSADPVGRNIQFIITVGSNGANNQISRDKLELRPEAGEVMYFVASPADPTNLGTAGIWVDGPVDGSRIVFFGFGFEAVNRPGEDETQITRSQLMRLVLDFLDGITGIDEPGETTGPGVPMSFALGQNYPNPFNPQTTIVYDIPPSAGAGVDVLLSVYNLRGRKVRTLVDALKTPGSHYVQWDGRNDRGEKLTSGVYFYRIEAGSYIATRKLLLIE